MPASTTEIAVGAWTWACGSHRWSGNEGTLHRECQEEHAQRDGRQGESQHLEVGPIRRQQLPLQDIERAGDRHEQLARGPCGDVGGADGHGLARGIGGDHGKIVQLGGTIPIDGHLLANLGGADRNRDARGRDLEVQDQHGQKHGDGSCHGVQEEFHRRTFSVIPAPDGDQEEHGDQHDLPEHVEEDHVQRQEGAVDAHEQKLHQAVVRPHATIGRSHHRSGELHQRRQKQHGDREPVDAHMPRDAPLGEQRDALAQDEAGFLHRDRLDDEQHRGGEQAQRNGDGNCLLGVVPLGQDPGKQRAHDGQEQEDGKDGCVDHGAYTRTRASAPKATSRVQPA
jgi:hypothetical protein